MPVWARSEQFDNWHPAHIAERYGLLTIIVLGEGVVGVSNTIQYFLTNSSSAASSIMFLGSSLVALVFSLWWLYFIVPFDTILNKERRRHDLFLFGYGHFFIFASIAGLGSMLNLVTESVAADTNAAGYQVISQPYAMGMLSVLLLTLTILRELMCHKSSHNVIAMFLALIIIGLSYMAVVQGLPITYGIWLIILAPVVMIWYFNQDNKQWLVKEAD